MSRKETTEELVVADGLNPTMNTVVTRDEDGNVALDAEARFEELKAARFESGSGSDLPQRTHDEAVAALAVIEKFAPNFEPLLLPGFDRVAMAHKLQNRRQYREYDIAYDRLLDALDRRCRSSEDTFGRFSFDATGGSEPLSPQLIFISLNPNNPDMFEAGVREYAAVRFNPSDVWNGRPSYFGIEGYMGINRFWATYGQMKADRQELTKAIATWKRVALQLEVGQYRSDPVQSAGTGELSKAPYRETDF